MPSATLADCDVRVTCVGLKAYQVEVMGGMTAGGKQDTFAAWCVITGEELTAEQAMQQAVNELHDSVAWVGVVSCRHATEIEEESRCLLTQMLCAMKGREL